MLYCPYFENKFIRKEGNIYIKEEKDLYVSNFGKQWKTYNKIQIDSENNFDISLNYLKSLLFDNLNDLDKKNILEIGAGAGRFTEHIVKYAKHCVAVDLSSAIYSNYSSNSSNLTLIKADFNKLIPKQKFDVVICRGVLQHTPDPLISIQKIHEFVKKGGFVFFDIYKMPKIGLFHPKYLIWRPLFQKYSTYEKTESFLLKNIKNLLVIKRLIKKIFLKSNFISDCIIPIWDYEGILKLSNEQLEKWSILDTLDGLFAYYDNPKRFSEITNFLKKKKINIINYNKNKNYFKTSI